MRKNKNLLLKTASLGLLLAGPAHAGNDAPSGKPCVIRENLKGSCFYSENGELVYWIAREWNTPSNGGGPTFLENEIIGYPAVLKEQQDYNRQRPAEKYIPAANAYGHYDDAAHRKNLVDIVKETADMMNGRYDSHETPYYYNSGDDPQFGWNHGKLTAPAHIPETGELNAETLRIPLYAAGPKILDAQARLKEDCDSSMETFWRYYSGPRDDSVYNDNPTSDLMCEFDHRPKNEKYANRQNLLKLRAIQLVSAAAAAARYDEIVAELNFPMSSGSSPSKAYEFPAGVTDQLSSLKTEMDEGLNIAADIETRYHEEKDADDRLLREAAVIACRTHQQEQLEKWGTPIDPTYCERETK